MKQEFSFPFLRIKTIFSDGTMKPETAVSNSLSMKVPKIAIADSTTHYLTYLTSLPSNALSRTIPALELLIRGESIVIYPVVPEQIKHLNIISSMKASGQLISNRIPDIIRKMKVLVFSRELFNDLKHKIPEVHLATDNPEHLKSSPTLIFAPLFKHPAVPFKMEDLTNEEKKKLPQIDEAFKLKPPNFFLSTLTPEELYSTISFSESLQTAQILKDEPRPSPSPEELSFSMDLRNLSKSKLIKWLEKTGAGENQKKKYTRNLQAELKIIFENGLSSIILKAHDIVQKLKAKNIIVLAGNGFASSSVVMFLLGISKINPIKIGTFKHIHEQIKFNSDIELIAPEVRLKQVISEIKKEFPMSANPYEVKIRTKKLRGVEISYIENAFPIREQFLIARWNKLEELMTVETKRSERTAYITPENARLINLIKLKVQPVKELNEVQEIAEYKGISSIKLSDKRTAESITRTNPALIPHIGKNGVEKAINYINTKKLNDIYGIMRLILLAKTGRTKFREEVAEDIVKTYPELADEIPKILFQSPTRDIISKMKFSIALKLRNPYEREETALKIIKKLTETEPISHLIPIALTVIIFKNTAMTFPMEFHLRLLNKALGNREMIQTIAYEMLNYGFKFVRPSLTIDNEFFTPAGTRKSIRIPLISVKHISPELVKRIRYESSLKPFSSFNDIVNRVNPEHQEIRALTEAVELPFSQNAEGRRDLLFSTRPTYTLKTSIEFFGYPYRKPDELSRFTLVPFYALKLKNSASVVVVEKVSPAGNDEYEVLVDDGVRRYDIKVLSGDPISHELAYGITLSKKMYKLIHISQK